MSRQQLVAAERWLLASELISQLRHTINNKLGSARNAAFFIRRSLTKSAVPTDPRLPAFFQIIDDELGAAGQALSSGIGSDRDRHFPSSRTNLRMCIEQALALRTPPEGIAVSVQCDETIALTLRPAELIVALCCLLDNAYESIAQVGEIGIVTEVNAEHITLSVIDSGSGFSTASSEHAFDPFYTTKDGHIGLGLNLVQRILKDLGGRAVIFPVPTGARVSVLLPQKLAVLDPPPPQRETI